MENRGLHYHYLGRKAQDKPHPTLVTWTVEYDPELFMKGGKGDETTYEKVRPK